VSSSTIEVKQLSFSFGRDVEVLHEWDASFLSGEVVGLSGPSGRGKSTLLYLLGLILRPVSGQILFNGVNVSEIGDGERSRIRAHDVGFVFQDAALDSTRTVLDNVLESALYRHESARPLRSRALSLLAQLGVEARADHKPGQVSGGQAQRIALCRALLGEPSIILADEPTGNLDMASSTVVTDTLKERAANGAIVIIASHDRDVLGQCDRVLTL
jgi:ABC-type lipoprotein export system ATPase subunit